MTKTTAGRLQALVRRINQWENREEPESTKDFIWAVEEDEELILDIKQCLLSVLEDATP